MLASRSEHAEHRVQLLLQEGEADRFAGLDRLRILDQVTALITRASAKAVPWAVLATDGAYKTMTHLGIADWPALYGASDQALADLLRQCQDWEASDDPDGQKLPRAKRHDDKSLAAAEFGRI